MDALNFDDGYVRFSIGTDPTEFAVDSMEATMVANALADKHGLEVRDGLYIFTEDFIVDLCKTYSERFKLPAITRTVANRIWLAAQLDIQGLKKNTSAPQEWQGLTDSTPSS